MKRNYLFVALLSFTIALLAAFALSANAQEWHTANQVTIQWDAVTALEGGTPIPEDNVIEYRVWLVNAVTDADKTNPTVLGITPETLYVITLNTEGKFFVGLQTLRKTREGVLMAESVVGWTDDPEIAADGVTFGIQYFLPGEVPSGASAVTGS